MKISTVWLQTVHNLKLGLMRLRISLLRVAVLDAVASQYSLLPACRKADLPVHLPTNGRQAGVPRSRLELHQTRKS